MQHQRAIRQLPKILQIGLVSLGKIWLMRRHLMPVRSVRAAAAADLRRGDF
jgi:hypothetical protein